MSPDVAVLKRPWFAGLSDVWRGALLRLAGVWLALIALFHADWAALAHQWWNSDSYNHILLVPLILAWLVHIRMPQLARLVPGGWKPGLLLFAGAALVWVLGSFAGLSSARQLGAVAMLAMSALAILGPRVGAGLAFPLGYMAFLVPFGEEFVPQLQMITAKLTIWLTELSGIPAKIDGVFIDTPAGLFEVAEACSGVRFLVAMVAVGVLVANVCFTSWKRRAAFMALSIAAPILANGVRAWATIFAAQYVGADKATGIDHLIYGWVFFAIVIVLVMAASWRFFDRAIDDAMIDADAIAASPLLARLEALALSPGKMLASLGALSVAALAWSAAANSLTAPLPGQLFLPEVPGWSRVDYAPREWWEPRASGAEHRLLGRYENAKGQQVDVFIAVYAAQVEGREAGGYGEGALTPDSNWSWASPGHTVAEGKSERLLGDARTLRLAETHYRTGALTTGSNVRLKLATLRDKLLLRARPTTMLILSAEERPGHSAAVATGAFRQSTGPLGAWMDRIAALR